MSKTLAEKILSRKSGREAKSGDTVIAKVDLVFAQDTTGPLVVKQFQTSGFLTMLLPVQIKSCLQTTCYYDTLPDKLAALCMMLAVVYATR